MPVKKFKTFEEAERDLWCFSPDEKYYKSMWEFLEFGSKLNKKSVPKGIFKFKSIEEAKVNKF